MNLNLNLTSILLHSRTQAHIYHFRTKNFAEHKALEAYYTGIVPLLDSFTEAYQGKYGLISGYKNYPLSQDPKTAVKYFENLIKVIQKVRIPPDDQYLQNILESIYELIYKTLYLLKNLK
uniref:Uncharacterized protein n=1 Tax=viral metagenome TaxID=1070528 RepID=A0A6C0I863_9ZZZZ